jgi:hypothetical protein
MLAGLVKVAQGEMPLGQGELFAHLPVAVLSAGV